MAGENESKVMGILQFSCSYRYISQKENLLTREEKKR
jgi:hypothetical protein